MNKMGVILLSCAALLLPDIARAQDASLEICNNGQLDVFVAVAARIQTFITGYKWQTKGWYTVAVGKCATVYDEDYDAAGPYTPQSGARVAFTLTRLDGVQVAYQSSEVQAAGWMRSGTGQICVNRTDAFTYERSSGDPAANCGGILVPVAHDFMPDGPGKFTYTIEWYGYASYIAIGKGGVPKSSVSNSGASDSVDNSLSAQFLRALAQSARDAQKKAADSATSSPDHAAWNAKGRADLLGWVHEDVTDYIAASKSGFEAYKSGAVQLSQGYRMWNSSVKPALALGCWVIQGDASTTFSCVIPESDTVAARAYYSQIADDVTASLPADWRPGADSPFGGDLPGKGYQSTSQAHGEIWLAHAKNGSGYDLNFQLVSAPRGTQAPKSDDDDPIGNGGVITPATPP
ncbi:MAG: DUF1036 domain-containing protein [Gemmatimonadota bacterium]|nr:DUF1036 domain-containing protein [Gemmatimonadota bacterium]